MEGMEGEEVEEMRTGSTVGDWEERSRSFGESKRTASSERTALRRRSLCALGPIL